jgi:hypothetical protein
LEAVKRLSGGAWLFLLLLLASLVGGGLSAAPYSKDELRTAVVMMALRKPGTDSFLFIGSAFHVGGRFFYTAAHVVRATLPEKYKEYTEWGIAGREPGALRFFFKPVQVVCVDPRWSPLKYYVAPFDFALVRLTDPNWDPDSALRIGSTRALRPGEKVSMWSYPDGKVLMEARGSVIAVDQDQIRVRREDGVVLPGSSGGAVLNEAGEVVGILQGMGEYEGESRVVAGTIEAAMKGCPLQR